MRRGQSLIEETVVGDGLQVTKPMRFKVTVSRMQDHGCQVHIPKIYEMHVLI